jgi:ribosomal protein S19E (S16A)
MKKRKPTYTKKHAADNRAMIRLAKKLLKNADADLDTVPKDHPGIKDTIQKEFPDVKDDRIWARMAQAMRQLRYEKYHTID